MCGAVQYSVVWCGVWCGVVWCGVVWCGVVWCGVMRCNVECCVIMQCNVTRDGWLCAVQKSVGWIGGWRIIMQPQKLLLKQCGQN